MMTRPAWERPLRRRLREKREGRGRLPGWLREKAAMMVAGFGLFAVLTHLGAKLLGNGGGGTGAGIVAGLVGTFLGMKLRASWLDHLWLPEWTPASRTVTRRIQTRETLPSLFRWASVVLALSLGGSLVSRSAGGAEVMAAALLSMTTGFLLAGGRFSMIALLASGASTIGYGILSKWLAGVDGDGWDRVVKAAAQGWIPVMPWSLPHHGAAGGAVQWILLGGVLVLSLWEWWKSWLELESAPAELSHAAPTVTNEPDTAEERSGPESSEQPAVDEDQRRNIRQQVAFAWFGLAGYLPDRPMPRIDRLIWRWLTPRQRMISTLGSHEAFDWFARTKWAASALAVMSGLAWLWKGLMERPGFSEWLDSHGYWGYVGLVALAAVAILNVWPSRGSRFKPWLEQMEAQGIGHFPSFALLPICPGEWLRSAAKEWAVRSAWMALLWTLAIAAALPAFSFEKSATTIIAWLLLPWLLGAALFPLSSMNRLVRAVSGPMLRCQGFSRTIPSILFGVLCPTASAAAALALGVAEFLVALILLSVAAATGWISLALTLNRCRNMRFDLKPKPLH